ncbi:MAG: hypothetical protein M0R80_28770 [Proteobacteria bacterium]|jgi:hypothetical protein|nr:hypothetical protein [Pseudomonadota bacterium]
MRLVSLGQVVSTPGALAALEASGQNAMEFLARHERNDWGDVSDGDKLLNDQALVDGGRLLSVYHLKDDTTRIWVITEADRSSTCILLPEEY